MNGTTVALNSEKRIDAFHMDREIPKGASRYKTVNIYSLSLESWKKVEKTLGRYIEENRLDEYYEAVFAEMVTDNTLSFDAVFFDAGQWYEIDTKKDLEEAEKLIARPRSNASESLEAAETLPKIA